MGKQHSVACVGAGYWGKNLVRNLDELGALHSIFDADPDRRAELADQYPDVRVRESYGEVLEDPSVDGVVIATPAETHADLTRLALQADKDVFVEKPLCLETGEAEALIQMADERDRILMVGHLLWYHPAVRKHEDQETSGDLGRIEYIYSNRLNLGRIRQSENILWSFAPHDISVILGLVGEMPDSIHAQGGNYLHDQIADVTVSVFSFPSGVRAHVFVSWLHPYKEQRMVVVGDEKMAVFDDTKSEDKLVLYPHTIDWQDRVPIARKSEGEPVSLEWCEPLRNECSAFLESIETRTSPRTDGREALRVLRVLSACQDSLERKDNDQNLAVEPPTAEQSGPPYSAHESAYVDDGAEVGAGTRIWHFSHVRSGARIGENCSLGQNVVIGPNVEIGDGVKIQNNVSVYEGVTLEDHVFCGPSMVFTNVYNPRSEVPRMDELRSTRVKKGASLGANCTVLCGVTIGRYAFVGAGAVVLDDVPDHGLVVGNPGRIVGWMCTCGNRIHFDGEGSDDAAESGTCSECERRYEKDDGTVQPSAHVE